MISGIYSAVFSFNNKPIVSGIVLFKRGTVHGGSICVGASGRRRDHLSEEWLAWGDQWKVTSLLLDLLKINYGRVIHLVQKLYLETRRRSVRLMFSNWSHRQR
jgi:hypothetical protein